MQMSTTLQRNKYDYQRWVTAVKFLDSNNIFLIRTEMEMYREFASWV